MSFAASIETQFLSSPSMEKNISMIPSTSPFHLPIEILLSQGGDDRLTLNSEMMNKYFSSTLPRFGVLRRGSCTSSTITHEVNFWHCRSFSSCLSRSLNVYHLYSLTNAKAYLDAAAVKENLMNQLLLSHQLTANVSKSISNVMYTACNNVRHRLARCLGYDCDSMIGMITFPSGSDAEYLPVIIALIRANLGGINITNRSQRDSNRAKYFSCHLYTYIYS